MSFRALIALTLAAVLAAAPALAAGKSSHAKLWQNKSNAVVCGIEFHAKSKPATHVLCSAVGLPAPKHVVGDPFVQISAHGKPVIVLLSQRSYEAKHVVTLKPGSTWSSLGVSCSVARKTVTCTNKSHHGFTIGKNKYSHH